MVSSCASVENELLFKDNTMMPFAADRKIVEAIVKSL